MMQRLFDIVLSLLGIIILSPFFIIISLLIIIDSKGGILFKQKRVGQHGKDFLVFKFRSMYVQSEKQGYLTVGNKDNRITKIGYYLRKYKLDELPQLFNVLFGSMSLVGPRPEVRKYVDLYDANDTLVLQVKPGITDYASAYFADENEVLSKQIDPEKYYIEVLMKEKIKMNMKYINNYTMVEYFKIIFLTLGRIIK